MDHRPYRDETIERRDALIALARVLLACPDLRRCSEYDRLAEALAQYDRAGLF